MTQIYCRKNLRNSYYYWQIKMLCYFQDFQAESAPVLSEADVQEAVNCLTCHVRGKSKLNLLCDNCYVQYFCRVREEQLRLYLIFTSIKMHKYDKPSTNYLYLLSSFSRQNISDHANHSFSPCSTTHVQNNH